MAAVKYGVKTLISSGGGRSGIPFGCDVPNEIVKSVNNGAMEILMGFLGPLRALAMTMIVPLRKKIGQFQPLNVTSTATPSPT